MKKMFLFLPAVLLALFISGCGKNPDAELQSKIPDSANILCLVDGNYVVQTRFYKENRETILKDLKKDDGLTEEFFNSRVLFFGSANEECGGLVFQTEKGQAAKLFEQVLAKCRESKKFNDVKESAEGQERRITATLDGKPVMIVLLNENLILAVVNKIDLAYYKSSKGNPLFREIRWKNSLVSAAVKVFMPEQGKGKEAANTVMQMVPSLQKLTFVSLNVPFAEQNPEVDFRMIFADEAAAGEMLATINMGMGFAAQESPELNTALTRKVEKNTVLVSFKVDEVEKAVKAIQAKQEKQKKARANAAKRKAKKAQAKKAQAKKQLPAKPAAQPEQPKAANDAVKAAPAEAPKAAAQTKAAEPAPAAKPAQENAAK